MRSQSTLSKTVIVPAHKLHVYHEYVERKIQELEGKNFSGEIGYIYEIIEISNVENFRVVKNNFSGSIVYKATFIVEHCIPQEGTELDCTILQSNNITVATNGPLTIFIIDEPDLPNLEKGDKVVVLILAKEVNHGADFIKVVGKLVRKQE